MPRSPGWSKAPGWPLSSSISAQLCSHQLQSNILLPQRPMSIQLPKAAVQVDKPTGWLKLQTLLYILLFFLIELLHKALENLTDVNKQTTPPSPKYQHINAFKSKVSFAFFLGYTSGILCLPYLSTVQSSSYNKILINSSWCSHPRWDYIICFLPLLKLYLLDYICNRIFLSLPLLIFFWWHFCFLF